MTTGCPYFQQFGTHRQTRTQQKEERSTTTYVAHVSENGGGPTIQNRVCKIWKVIMQRMQITNFKGCTKARKNDSGVIIVSDIVIGCILVLCALMSSLPNMRDFVPKLVACHGVACDQKSCIASMPVTCVI